MTSTSPPLTGTIRWGTSPRRPTIFAAGLFALALAAPAPARAGRAPVRAIDSVGITVSDMDCSVRFFTDDLGFEPVSVVAVAGEDYEAREEDVALRMRV